VLSSGNAYSLNRRAVMLKPRLTLKPLL